MKQDVEIGYLFGIIHFLILVSPRRHTLCCLQKTVHYVGLPGVGGGENCNVTSLKIHEVPTVSV